MGPGLTTGAADDDPSGIATYSQTGAQFGYGQLWTALYMLPFMTAVQEACARIGLVTGKGIAAVVKEHYSKPVLYAVVSLVVIANTINIAADLGAMGEAVRLLVGGSLTLYVLAFGTLSVTLQIVFSYESTVRILKWLTLALFSYVAVILTVSVPWSQMLKQSALPWSFIPANISLKEYSAMVVAVLGTTISPYLFFWQAAQEVEDDNRRPDSAALKSNPAYAAEHLYRIKQDTMFGMIFSNVIALCIVIATAVTLNEHGVTDIQTAAQAAEALRPVAGEFAFAVFSLGIIGTGLLAVPVLAGSAAYAGSELLGWKAGLSNRFHEARGFYLIIIAATVMGMCMEFFEVNPIKALVWSAIVNGVISVPIMAVMMWIGQSTMIMGKYTISLRHRFFGWAATLVMALSVAFMFVSNLLNH